LNFSKHKLVLIGASTGGPGLLEQIVTSCKSPLQGSIILAQHMHKVALASFAKRLNRIHPETEVIFCQEKITIQTNKIYLLSDSSILQEEQGLLSLTPSPQETEIYHPTIDRLFCSAATLRDYEIHAYLLSGIGADGAKGLLALKEQGHTTVAQDEETSIVYGMPKAAKERNAATKILSIDAIKKDIDVFMA